MSREQVSYVVMCCDRCKCEWREAPRDHGGLVRGQYRHGSGLFNGGYDIDLCERCAASLLSWFRCTERPTGPDALHAFLDAAQEEGGNDDLQD